MNILVIEDEPAMAALLKQGLEEMRYKVETVLDGEAGLQRLLTSDESDFSLLILDGMLPGKDGFEIIQELRRRRRTVPILMLTARDSVTDRVKGLALGADDYLPKPFEFAELVARIRALLRRERIHRADVVEIDDLVVDTAARKVVRNGRDVALTAREYILLEALAVNEGRILTREAILERVWMDAPESASNTVEVHIKSIRRKLEGGEAESPQLIYTIRGLGYTLRRPEAAFAVSPPDSGQQDY